MKGYLLKIFKKSITVQIPIEVSIISSMAIGAVTVTE